MSKQEDEATLRARESVLKRERKNYTYRLPIYLAELFAEICKQKDISPVVLIEQWIQKYVESLESKFGPDVLAEINDIIETKKQNEKLSRDRQKRKRRKL